MSAISSSPDEELKATSQNPSLDAVGQSETFCLTETR